MNQTRFIEVCSNLSSMGYNISPSNQDLIKNINQFVNKLNYNQTINYPISIWAACAYFKHDNLGIMLSNEEIKKCDDKVFVEWITDKDIRPYVACGNIKKSCEMLLIDFLEHLRIQERDGYKKHPKVKESLQSLKPLYTDINKEESLLYQSKSLGKININNINIGKSYIYVDSFLTSNTSNSFYMSLNNKEQNFRGNKSLPYVTNNIKSLKISDVFLPQSNNYIISSNDIIKMGIKELSNLSHREYPNINYIFIFKVEAFGSRFKLIPLNDTYQFTEYITTLTSLTFIFYIQNRLLTFASNTFEATITIGSPTLLTFTSHGLSTGDVISIYDFSSSPSYISELFKSTYIVTTTGANTFTIDFDSTLLISPLVVTYYVIKKKLEFNLEITYI